NTVNPGPVDTDRWDGLEKAFARDMGVDQAEARRRAEASIPIGRITQPQEVAALVAFMASDLAPTLHGAHVPIDGAQRKALMERSVGSRMQLSNAFTIGRPPAELFEAFLDV